MAATYAVEPIRAALVIDQLSFDRLGPIIGHLTVGLLDSISEILLITPAAAAQRLSLGPVRVIEHPCLRWPMRERITRRIIKQLAEHPPTLFHAVSSRSFALARELALEAGRPLVGHILGTEDLHPRSQAAFDGMDKVIAASKPLVELSLERHLVDADRVVLVRPGLLRESGPSCFVRGDQIPTLLCMSALELATGVDRLIRAVRILVTEKQDLMLFLVARGPAEGRLRKLVEREGLIKHVTFGQPMSDWLQTMRAADVFIVPGDVDRVDLRLLHALAAGMAAVTGEMPNSDFVIDRRTAMVCPNPTAESLAKTIRELLHDRAEARLLASRALEHCKQHHSLSDMAQKTADVYHELLASPVPAGTAP